MNRPHARAADASALIFVAGIVLLGVEPASRSIARVSFLSPAASTDAPTLPIVLSALALSCLALAALRWGARLTPDVAAAVLLVLAFVVCLAAQLRLGARLQSDGFYYFVHLRSLWFLALAGLTLMAWNLTFMGAALKGRVLTGESVAFVLLAGEQAATLGRIVGHPFSWPANLIFAARNGVAPSEYDLLFATRFLCDPKRPYRRIDVGSEDGLWLEDGWGGPERGRDVTYRWATLEDNGSPQSLLTIPSQWGIVEQTVPVTALWSSLNRIRLRFSRAARPRDVGVARDDRQLAAASDYICVEEAR